MKYIFVLLTLSITLNLSAQDIYQQKRKSGNMVSCQDHADLKDPKITYTYCTIDDPKRNDVWKFLKARKLNDVGVEVPLENPPCVNTFNTCLAYHLVCSRFTWDESCAYSDDCSLSNPTCNSKYKSVDIEALRKQNIVEYEKLKTDYLKKYGRDPKEMRQGALDDFKKRLEFYKKERENEKKSKN
ncbi:MAG: hypothetical protein OHK0056_21310 [Bacteriovoracaceae bacterium]